MTNTVDEFIESLVAATINKEVVWQAGSVELQNLLEEVYGNSEKLYSFLDEEAGANVVLATYQYVEEEATKAGSSILLVDDEDFEILNEVTDEDTDDAELFSKLIEAIEEVK